MLRKTSSMILALLMLTTVLSSCSSQGAATPAPTAATATPAPTAAVTPAPTAAATSAPMATAVQAPSPTVAANGEMKTLRVLVWDLAVAGMLPIGDNYWTRWVQQNFGDPNSIKVEYVAMPRWEEVAMLNVWMAGQEAPDVIFTFDINLVVNYLRQGGLADLTDAFAQYGANFRALTGDDVLEYGIFDGKQMVLPTKRDLPAIVGSAIRGDWLEKVGMPVPTTTEEWYDTMVAFKEQDPGGLGELNTPVGMGMQEISFGYFNMLYSFIDPGLTQKELTLTYPFLYPGYKEGVRFINKLYNEGMISPEFSLDADSSKLTADISNGYVGFYTQNVLSGMGPGGSWENLAANVPDAHYLACDPFTNSEGKRPKLANQPYGKFLMVPSFSKMVDEAVQYIDWQSQPDIIKMLQLGVEGKHHTVKDGVYTYVNSTYEGEDKHSAQNNYEISIVTQSVHYGDLEAARKNRLASYTNPEAAKQFDFAMTDIRQDPWFFPYFKKPVVSEGQYATAMIDKYKEIFTRVFMCSPNEFDALYDSLVDEFMTMYGNEICAERAQVWAETME